MKLNHGRGRGLENRMAAHRSPPSYIRCPDGHYRECGVSIKNLTVGFRHQPIQRRRREVMPGYTHLFRREEIRASIQRSA